MKAKKYCCLFLAVALVLLLMSASGCGKEKVTAKSLMEEVSANMEEVESARMNLKADITMGMKQSGISMDLEMNMDMDIESTKDPAAAYIKGNLSMNLMGINMEMESYSVVEDGKAVSYAGMAGEWTRTEAPIENGSEMAGINGMFADGTSFDLQKKTEKIDGREVYVLEGEISGRYMEDVMEDMSGTMGDIDWSDMTMDVVLKIDAKTKMPVEAVMDCGDALSGLMEGAMAAAGAGDAEVSIDDFIMTCTYESFDDVDEIVVPESVKKAAGGSSNTQSSLDSFLNNSEPQSDIPSSLPEQETESGQESEAESGDTAPLQNADGTYTLTHFFGKDSSVNVAVPEGYEVSPYSDSEYLTFTDTSDQPFNDIYIGYMLDDDYTEEEMEEYYISDVEYYEKDDSYSDVEVQEKKTVNVDGRDVSYVKISYVYEKDSYYVDYGIWTFLPDGGVVQCEVTETSYQTPCSVLDDSIVETVMSGISE